VRRDTSGGILVGLGPDAGFRLPVEAEIVFATYERQSRMTVNGGPSVGRCLNVHSACRHHRQRGLMTDK
jgi:hypothetical protein